MTVRIGEHDLNKETGVHSSHNVTKVIVRPNYLIKEYNGNLQQMSTSRLKNILYSPIDKCVLDFTDRIAFDIALLKLEQPVQMTDYVNTCLLYTSPSPRD